MADFLSVFGVITPFDYVLTILATFAGIIVGAIPGLGATMAVAILTSFTATMETLPSMAVLVGIYMGAVYGGSISATLMKVPGTAAAIMTSEDAYPMAKRGEAGKAIGISAYSSFWGGIIGSIFLVVGCGAFSIIATKFAYPEYFVLAVFGLCIIAGTDDNLFKGIVSVAFGLLISFIGMDNLTGTIRLTMGIPSLMGGCDLIAVLIGIFGVAELIKQLTNIHTATPIKQKLDHIFPTKEIRKRIHKVIVKSSLIGVFIGILPGAGAQISSFVAYETQKNSSKNPEEYGTGVPEGIAAPESANNATVGGTLIPALVLSVPGDPTTAIFISALALHGVICGPTIFSTSPESVNGIGVFLFVSTFAMLIMAITFAPFFARIINLNPRILVPIVLVTCIVGTYSSSYVAFNIIVMVVMGIIGFLMEKVGLSPAAAILGVVLGKLLETNMRSALVMSQGDYTIFLRPICLFFWAVTIIMVGYPRVKKLVQKVRAKKAA